MPTTTANWQDPNYVTGYLNDLVRRREAVSAGQGDPTGRQTSLGQINTEYQRVYGNTRDLFPTIGPGGQVVAPGGMPLVTNQPVSAAAGAPPAAMYIPYQPKQYQTLSSQDAMTQARGEIDPITRIMEQRTNKVTRDKRSVLPQLLNARGQASGGLRDAKERQLSQDQAMMLNEITMQQDASARQLGRQLQTRSEDVALQRETQDFQRWATEQGLSMQQAQAAFTQWAAIQGIDDQRAATLWSQDFQEEGRDYTQGRDIIADKQAEKNYALQERGVEANMTGYDPKTGQMTPAYRSLMSGILGYDPLTGEKTLTFQQIAAQMSGDIPEGMPGAGKKTWAAQSTIDDRAAAAANVDKQIRASAANTDKQIKASRANAQYRTPQEVIKDAAWKKVADGTATQKDLAITGVDLGGVKPPSQKEMADIYRNAFNMAAQELGLDKGSDWASMIGSLQGGSGKDYLEAMKKATGSVTPEQQQQLEERTKFWFSQLVPNVETIAINEGIY